ncbi:hypothetical protein BT69DRAFT_1278855 [Atractiella rhizophila]|nr:hypothetical protein BT69DRAFT_1278855 [Atractiella rhizophila]
MIFKDVTFAALLTLVIAAEVEVELPRVSTVIEGGSIEVELFDDAMPGDLPLPRSLHSAKYYEGLSSSGMGLFKKRQQVDPVIFSSVADDTVPDGTERVVDRVEVLLGT